MHPNVCSKIENYRQQRRGFTLQCCARKVAMQEGGVMEAIIANATISKIKHLIISNNEIKICYNTVMIRVQPSLMKM